MLKPVAVVVVAGSLILGAPLAGALQEEKDDAERDEPIVFTNDDLPPAPEPSGAVSTTPAPRPPAAAPAIPSYEGYRDRDGHGEGWWRQRAAVLELRVLDAAVRAQKLHVDYVRGKTLVDPTLAERSREATLYLKEVEAERDRLPEELRRAGGLPGWLRGAGQPFPDELLPAPEPGAASFGDGLTLSWSAVVDAGFYIVEVECAECCGPIEPCDVSSLDVTGTVARFPAAEEGSGRWRVRALDRAGFPGAWSAWQDLAPSP